MPKQGLHLALCWSPAARVPDHFARPSARLGPLWAY